MQWAQGLGHRQAGRNDLDGPARSECGVLVGYRD